MGVALTVLGVVACSPGADRDAPRAETLADVASLASVRPRAEGSDLVQGDTLPGLPSWTRQDWELLRQTATWAWQNGVDTLAVGDRIARIGETFVGTPYLPRTLDPPGPERLVGVPGIVEVSVVAQLGGHAAADAQAHEPASEQESHRDEQLDGEQLLPR